MTPARTVALPALLAAGLLTGCASDSTAITSTPVCSTPDHKADNGVLLMAQSVPTASYVPCIRAALPLGWAFHHLDARNGVARFWLDSDRDGQQAVEVRLEKSCDTTGASVVPSDRDGIRRLERVDRVTPSYAGKRYYLFPGGCLTVVFALHSDSAGEALALASQAVGVVSRDRLRAQVEHSSHGRLSLDAPPKGSG